MLGNVLFVGVITSLFTAFSASAVEPGQRLETRTVHGTSVTLQVEGEGRSAIYKLSTETTIPMAGGNSITLTDAELSFYNNPDGSTSDRIGLITVYESNTTQWTLPSGETFALNCGRYSNDQRPRLITIYKNMQIERGCSVGGGAEVTTVDGQTLQVSASSGLIDFNKEGFVKYVKQASTQTFEFQGQTFPLAPDRDISYHSNKTPYFFTIAAGHSLTYESASIGTLELGNPPQGLLSMIFADNGKLQAAYVKTPFEVQSEYFSTIKAGAGPVAFSEKTEKLDFLSLTFPQAVTVAGVDLELQGKVQFYSEDETDYKIQTAELNGSQTLTINGQYVEASGTIGFHQSNQNILGFTTPDVISITVDNKQVDISGPIGLHDNGSYRFVQVLTEETTLYVKQLKTEIRVTQGDRLVLDESGSAVLYLIPKEVAASF